MAGGGCFCGAVRYEVSAAPLMKAQCHCRACQYFSGGGPNYFALIARDAFTMQGETRSFTHPDSQRGVTRQFCPACGTHLTTDRRGLEHVVLKIGTLDDPAALYSGPDIAIYCEEKAAFHAVPDGVTAFDTLPPRR